MISVKLVARGNRYYRLRAPGMTRDDPPLSQHMSVENAYEAAVTHAARNGIDGTYTIEPPDGWEVETMGFAVSSAPPPRSPGHIWINELAVNVFEHRQFTFTVSRGGGNAGAVAVDWSFAISEGSPNPSSGTVEFADGDSTPKIVTVQLGGVITTQQGTVTLTNPRSTSGGAAPSLGTATLAVNVMVDNTPPTQPQLGTPIALSSSSIQVPLLVPSVDDGSGFLRYTLMRATNAGFTQNVVQEAQGDASIFPRTVTGLSASTTYYFRLIAEDRAGNTTLSSVVSASTLGGGSALYLFDTFDYAVDRIMDRNAKRNAYVAHGWSGCKDNNDSAGARGYIFNVSSIPGYSGQIPGQSGRMLCIEGQSAAQQGDLYLQAGDNSIGSIPMPIWIQWWMYINRSGSQMSSFVGGGKFIYPLPSGPQNFYPAPTLDTSLLGGFSTSFFNENKSPVSAPSAGALVWSMESFPRSVAPTMGQVPENERRADVHALRSDLYHRMGPWNAAGNDCWLFPNQWYLCRYHADLTGVQGRHEFWYRRMGDQTWIKTHEWIGGQTPGFNWNVFDIDRLGWRMFRMPTTLRGDFWIYLADFAIGQSAGSLPNYTAY